MHKRTSKPVQTRRLTWTGLVTLAVLVLLLTVLSASPAPPAEPPLRGCFDKALSEDLMICYILEQAQEEEIIEVAAIYRADDDLHYVYLTQTEPVGDKVGEFFRDKAEEFIDSWPEIALKEPYPDYVSHCMGERRRTNHPRSDYKSCLLETTGWEGDRILPDSTTYGAILVRPGRPPLGDCFDKALSNDPMICYILEQAQEEEIIDVAAIYRADDDLHYAYLTQTEPVGDKVGEFFRDRAEEFIDSWPEIAPQEPYREYYELCMYHQRDTRAWRLWWHNSRGVCLRELTRWSGDDILPYSRSYGRILLRPGGPDARHSERAWASFRQVWPAAVTPDTSGAFDVSDVDVTNFPEFGCLRLEYRESCEAGTDHPKADIAGWEVGGGITYVQYKNPPEGEEELEALKDTLIPYCNKVAVCTQVLDTTTGEATTIATAISTKRGTPARLHGPLASAISTTESALTIFSDDLEQYHNELAYLLRAVLLHPNDTVVTFVYPKGFVSEMEIIPVNHNYADLRRYETILNRFVHSRGNTIGILGAELSTNRRIAGDNLLWTPNGPGKAEKQTPSGYYYDWALIRDTIVVSAFDSQRVLNALTKLLPALGIPAEAVGAVYEESDIWDYDIPNKWYPKWPPYPCPFPCFPQRTPVLHQFLAAVGVPHWMPLWVSYTVLGIIVLGIMGSIVFITYRLLIRLVRNARLRLRRS